jgi:hypothetical protein
MTVDARKLAILSAAVLALREAVDRAPTDTSAETIKLWTGHYLSRTSAGAYEISDMVDAALALVSQTG